MPTVLRTAQSDGQVHRGQHMYVGSGWPGQLEEVAAYASVKNKEGAVSRRPRPIVWQPDEGSEAHQQGELTNEVTFRSAIPRAPVDCAKQVPARYHLAGRRSSSSVSNSEALLPGKSRLAEHFRTLSVGADGGTPPAGRETCRYFLRTGTCGYGDKCRYEHPKTAQKPELNTLGYPLRQGECACRFFIKNGWCGFGATCKFHHPELPARKPHSPGAMSVPGRYPPSSFGLPPSPHMGGVHHQAMYQSLMPPGAPAMSPAMHMPQGMYPYMLMGGVHPMLPPVAPAWALTPPEAPGAGRHFSLSRRHSAHHAGRDSVSDESTASVVSSGYEHEIDLRHEDYRYRSELSPESPRA